MSGERDHAALGASNAHRWMNCPGSVAAEAGVPRESSVYAEEGSAAHALAELCLDLQRDASNWLGEEVKGHIVTEEMAEAVQFYLDHVRAIAARCHEFGFERKFNLAPLHPPRPMFGTTDFYGFERAPAAYILHVADLKYGKGHAVSAVDNPQGRYYALGAWVDLATRNYAQAREVTDVEVRIIQPRILDADGQPTVSVERLPIGTLRLWARELLAAAARTTVEGAARIAGDHCRWCAVKGTCVAFRDRALAVAQTAFPMVEARTVTVPNPMEMTAEQLAAVLEHKDLLESFLAAAEASALARLEAGQPVPGWALKPKRATRKWVDDTRVVSWATEKGGPGLKKSELFEQELKSPAKLEKLVGKGRIPEDLIVAQSSGYTLCRDTNPRAVAPANAVDAFPVLPSPESLL